MNHSPATGDGEIVTPYFKAFQAIARGVHKLHIETSSYIINSSLLTIIVSLCNMKSIRRVSNYVTNRSNGCNRFSIFINR
jgi:hypothetical protein